MKKLLLTTAVLMTAWAAQAQTVETFSFTPGVAIPDGDNSGIVNVQNPGSSIVSITDIEVSLDIAGAPPPFGGFNGDLYVQLTHAGGLSVLLNRPGRTAGNLPGHLDGGLNFVFNDGAAVNAHDYITGGNTLAAVAGTFQPDGRTVDPLLVLDTDPTNPAASLLGAFAGLDAAGDWNLLLVDNQGGTGDMTLTGWSITLTGVAGAGGVPEPGTLALFAVFLGVLPLVRRWRTST